MTTVASRAVTIVVTDADLLAELDGVDDDTATTICQQVFNLGVDARRVMNTDAATVVINEHLEGFATRVADITYSAQTTLLEQINAVIDPETGQFAKTAATSSDQIASTINTAFNPDDRQSAASALIDTIAAKSNETVTAAIRDIAQMLDASRPDSPLAQMRRELANELVGPLDKVGDQVTSMHSVIVERERRPNSTSDGVAFEQVVGAALSDAATVCGDTVTPVGADTGIGTSKVGDFTVDVTDPTGRVGRFAIEAKDRNLGPKAIRTQLEETAANRTATAAILVVSQLDYGWQQQPLHRVAPGRYVAVLDSDPLAMRVAYQMARVDVLTELAASSHDDNGVDLDAIRSRVDQARRLLDGVSAIKGTLTSAVRSIERGHNDLDTLRKSLVEVLDDTAADMACSDPQDEAA